MAKVVKLTAKSGKTPAPINDAASSEWHQRGLELCAAPETDTGTDRQLFESWFPGDPARAERIGPRFKELAFQIVAASADVGDDTPIFMESLRDFIEQKFPRPKPSRPSLPKRAPTLWKDRDPAAEMNPALFTRETYARWLGHGLTRQHLRNLDSDLYRALSVWEHRHPTDRIAELPTLAEVIDARIAALADEFPPDELRKLGSTLQTRHRRSKI